MRGFEAALALLALVALVAVAPAGLGTGGVSVQGAGTGTTWSAGDTTCVGHPLVVHVLYLPDRQGIVGFHYYGAGDCPFRTGGNTAIGTVTLGTGQVPPTARWSYNCQGDEATGMSCSGDGVSVQVGPYNGPGGAMWIAKRGGARNFDGVFTAA